MVMANLVPPCPNGRHQSGSRNYAAGHVTAETRTAGAMETGSRGEIHLSSPIIYSWSKPIGRGQLFSHHNGQTPINHSPLHALGHK